MIEKMIPVIYIISIILMVLGSTISIYFFEFSALYSIILGIVYGSGFCYYSKHYYIHKF